MNLLIQKIYDVFAANAAIFTAAGLQPLQTIDRYRRQPLEPEKFEFYQTPALFIDYRIRWERTGRKYDGHGTLDVHVVTDNPFDTGNIFTNKEVALKQVFWFKIARQLLDGLESDNTGKLYRMDERPVDTGVVVYHILTYGFNYYDHEVGDGNSMYINDAEVQIVGKQLVKKLN